MFWYKKLKIHMIGYGSYFCEIPDEGGLGYLGTTINDTQLIDDIMDYDEDHEENLDKAEKAYERIIEIIQSKLQ